MKKRITLIVVMLLLLSMIGTAFAGVEKAMENNKFNYTMADYESVLPFKLSPADRTAATKLFDEITVAFEKNELDKAQKSLDAFYNVVGKYWINEDTLKVLLPFDEMMAFGGQIMTPEQKEALTKDFKSLTTLRKEKKFEAYFDTIKKIHKEYYKFIGQSIGDTNNELMLVQYIKGADKLTPEDLVNYQFEDYLAILPFTLNDQDYVKGKAIFDKITDALKANKMDDAKKLGKELNGVLAPYWISKDTLNLIVPHDTYQKEVINFMSRKDQLKMEEAYKAIEKAREATNFDVYFKAIDNYFVLLGESIQNFYGDYFDEIVFIKS